MFQSITQLIEPCYILFFFRLFIYMYILFYIGAQLINNVLLVSGVQQSDSVIHIHVSILFQILFPFRLLQSIEQSSLCYNSRSCWSSILNIAVCTCYIFREQKYRVRISVSVELAFEKKKILSAQHLYFIISPGENSPG